MLQFITHTADGLEAVLKGGCRWVQFRMKDATDADFIGEAQRAARLCRQYGATFIIDDRVDLVKTTGADGVHLGKNDMPLRQARAILGSKRIIGATANTAADIVNATKSGADYIGLGPFRFTTTKKNLSPLLGIEGYRDIMTYIRSRGIRIPVVAIGGITPDDLASLRSTGVSGVAVSGVILNSNNPEKTTNQIIEIWKN